MLKKIKRITKREMKPNHMGFSSVDMFHTEFDFEPFLVFTEFHMDKAIFGPHPHAGVSVMTYMMPGSEGSFLNRDSLGDHSIIEPGGIHVTQTGSGIQHDEVPTVDGVDCHGFQIWINHSDENRLVQPKAFHAFANEVPEYIDDHVTLRIIQGDYKNMVSPIQLVTKTLLFDVRLQPGSNIEFDTAEMAFLYLMKGSVNIGETTAGAVSLVNFASEGDKIMVRAGNEGAHFMVASGTPHRESIVHSGPFVMTTKEQMKATKERLHRGEMGELLPLR